MFKKLWQDLLQAMHSAMWRVVRAGVIGVAVGALAVEITGYVVDGDRWPPHLVVHVAAGAFALLLGYAVATTALLIEGVRGLGAAVSRLDDVARASAETGLNVLDAMVDAVDGPNRHGFRGRRGPTVPTIPPLRAVVPAPAAYPPSHLSGHAVKVQEAYPRDYPTWPRTAQLQEFQGRSVS